MVFFLKISVNFLSVSPEKRQLETPETARTAGGCGCLDAQKRQGFLLLFVVASSISLISAPKGENSLIPLLLLSPPNPLALGFGGGPIWSSAEPRKRPNSPSNPPGGAGPSPALQSVTQPLTAGSTGLLGPVALGASAIAAAPSLVPTPPVSAGSTDQSHPVAAVLCTTNSRFGSSHSGL